MSSIQPRASESSIMGFPRYPANDIESAPQRSPSGLSTLSRHDAELLSHATAVASTTSATCLKCVKISEKTLIVTGAGTGLFGVITLTGAITVIPSPVGIGIAIILGGVAQVLGAYRCMNSHRTAETKRATNNAVEMADSLHQATRRGTQLGDRPTLHKKVQSIASLNGLAQLKVAQEVAKDILITVKNNEAFVETRKKAASIAVQSQPPVVLKPAVLRVHSSPAV